MRYSLITTVFENCDKAIIIVNHIILWHYIVKPNKLLKTRSITPAQTYLEEMASEGKKLLVHIYNERVALSDRLLPFMAARNSQGEAPKKKRKNKAKALSPDRNQPGSESRNGL